MKKIISIEVNNSSFYDNPFKIEFSEHLNCVMGGRGTGKSTLLYFLKSSLELEAEDDRTTYSILKNNLGSGTIIVTLQDESGKKYKVEKTIDEAPQPYLLPVNRFVELKNIYSSIQCDFYEAQAIEEIGKNSYDRLSLIDKMILNEKDDIESEIEGIQIELKDNAQQIRSENERLSQLLTKSKNFDTADDDLKKLLEEKPDDINNSEERAFENADKNEKLRSAEKRFVKNSINKLEELNRAINELNEDVISFKTGNTNIDRFLNKEDLQQINIELISALDKVVATLTENEKYITSKLKNIEKLSTKLSEKHSIQQNEFTKLKQKFEKHKEFYNKWNALTKRIDDKNALEKEIKDIKFKRDKVKKTRKGLVAKLNEKKKELFTLRKGKIDFLNKKFDNSIKITITLGGITNEYEDALRNSLRGSNMRYNAIIPSIVQNFSPDRFAEVVHNKEFETLKKVAGIDKERSEAIFNALYETDAIYNIESIHCPDLPEFLLKIDAKGNAERKEKENYKKSDELSTGQRCTTVLPIVFAVSQNPLIIDQPEDNLDNKYISDTIHEIIKEQKSQRQLIFITHNPNIPVLSDSDRNFFLSYSDKKSRVDASGSVNDVKEHILNLLEGGKEAFEKRDKLYNNQGK